jgi:uncharacterized protein YbjT (DUF2867 family)
MALASPYVITGASGHIGSGIAQALLQQGLPVRVVGRSAARLAPFTAKGAEAAVGSLDDPAFLARAFAGARAAFVMIPPDLANPDFPAYQRRIGESEVQAIAASGVRHVVALSSIGAHQPEGLGPITGLHLQEQRLDKLAGIAVLHLRPAYFMENHLRSVPVIKAMGVAGAAMPADVPFPQIATRDVAAVAARRLAALDFTGSSVQELHGAKDLTMAEAARALGAAIGKPDLAYVQFPYDEARKAMLGAGLSPSMADGFIEMTQGFAAGLGAPTQPRGPATTTPTTIQQFAKEVFAPVYQSGRAAHG